jgi:DNA-binding FadR family transcriptional regulator
MVSEQFPAPADRDRLHVFVVKAFETRILSGELQVGDRLPSEAEIARLLNISTRSVREGLQILETKGLVRRRHGERAEVVRDDVEQFLTSLAGTVRALFAKDPAYLVQVMEVRRMFELEAVGRLAAGEGGSRAPIEEALAAMEASIGAQDFGQFTESDAAFHRALVQALGNDILSTLYSNLHDIVADVIRVTSRVPRKTLAAGFAEHDSIYALIAAGKADAARAAMRAHIDNSTDYLEQAIRNSGQKQE